MKFSRSLMVLAAALACAGVSHAQTPKASSNDIYKPTGKGWGELDLSTMTNEQRAQTLRAQRTSNLTYQGGPVMVGTTTNVYFIWYGTWDSGSQGVLTNLAQNIGGSPYFNINTTYYDKTSTHVKNSVTYKGATSDSGSLGTSLTDANIQTIVANAINSGKVPSDTNAIYFVLTDKNTTETSGFCSQYCGWHTHGTINGADIKYAFIGNPETQCPSGCGVNSPSLTAYPAADAMASVVSHELEEAVTDPDLNAWYSTRDGQENADKCAWNFGTTSIGNNGAKYNQVFGGQQYLIQQNWSLLPTQGCMQHYP